MEGGTTVGFAVIALAATIAGRMAGHHFSVWLSVALLVAGGAVTAWVLNSPCPIPADRVRTKLLQALWVVPLVSSCVSGVLAICGWST